jgi:hypothetical protein
VCDGRGVRPDGRGVGALRIALPVYGALRSHGYVATNRVANLHAWRQMAMFVGHWSLRGFGVWAVEERATGAFIGRMGTLSVIRPDNAASIRVERPRDAVPDGR